MFSKKIIAFVFAMSFVVVAGSIGTAGGAHAACEATDKIDKTTITDARKAIEGAGYRQVRDLKKGCDNFWHGTATKDGKPAYVVVSPKGEVMTESEQ
jgi:hypothetical protein